MNRIQSPQHCCPVPEKQNQVNHLLPETFLPASYFLVMLLALAGFPEILVAGRETGSSQTLLAMGTWGTNSIVFCPVSFLYYSEGDKKLKSLFAYVRMLSLSSYPLLFWWAMYKSSAALQPFEWSVVFGLCASLFLIFMGFVLRVQQKQLLTSYLFIASVLLSYTGAVMLNIGQLTLASFLIAAGILSLVTFALQTQLESQTQIRSQSHSKHAIKCKAVETLLLLSLILQWLSLTSSL
jgi:hypothetical protein